MTRMVISYPEPLLKSELKLRERGINALGTTAAYGGKKAYFFVGVTLRVYNIMSNRRPHKHVTMQPNKLIQQGNPYIQVCILSNITASSLETTKATMPVLVK